MDTNGYFCHVAEIDGCRMRRREGRKEGGGVDTEEREGKKTNGIKDKGDNRTEQGMAWHGMAALAGPGCVCM